MGHYWPITKTASELLTGASIPARRLAQGLSQEQAASRASLGLRTWRRLERDGHATTETLVMSLSSCDVSKASKACFPCPPQKASMTS